MPAFSVWLTAARPRTLPLAASATLCGGLLAAQQQHFRPEILVLSTATAVLLQLFSNLANDYGDFRHGADHPGRIGPLRVTAAGRITPSAMKRALVQTALCTVFSGSLLIMAAHPPFAVWWFALGAVSLSAAAAYTLGKRPYGYYGGGDAAVWIFFGGVGVCGSAMLHTGTFQAAFAAPACALGFACTMVLNLNNMRDAESDRTAGKYTIANRLGITRAKHYHTLLALGAGTCWWQWLATSFPRGAVPLMAVWLLWTAVHCVQVYRIGCLKAFNRLLPQWSMGLLLWVILLWAVFIQAA